MPADQMPADKSIPADEPMLVNLPRLPLPAKQPPLMPINQPPFMPIEQRMPDQPIPVDEPMPADQHMPEPNGKSTLPVTISYTVNSVIQPAHRV